MPPIVVALFAGAGIAAWVYNRSMRYTGNNTKNSVTIAGVSGVIAFIITLTIISFINSALES